jgi:hypothetical protein
LLPHCSVRREGWLNTPLGMMGMGARPRAVAPPIKALPVLMLCQRRPRGKDDNEALSLGAAPWGALPIAAALRGLLPIAEAPLSALLQ